MTITLLVLKDYHNRKMIEKAVARTLRRKIHRKKKTKHPRNELKGHRTDFSVKQYFLRQLMGSEFQIYTLALNKRKVPESERGNPEELYDFLARNVISQAPLELAFAKINIILDKRKNAQQIHEFNTVLLALLQERLSSKMPIYISHLESHESKELQAVDMFCWGIFQKYERNESQWYELFQEKIVVESVYPP